LDLLDAEGELRLRTAFNIFVGGNILDRGITIPNLIAFYYGRNPQTMQADTVLQHSRMYGNRDRRDLAVTRLYTSQGVYDRLWTINEFENTLRQAFESGAHEQGVVFIQTDPTSRVRPCAPNKVRLSDVVAVRPRGLLLPTGFDTIGGSAMNAIQGRLDRLIEPAWRDTGKFVDIDRSRGFEIISCIEDAFTFAGVEFVWDAMRGLIDYYSDEERGGDGSLLALAETGRRLDRARSGDKSGLSILGTASRPMVVDAQRSKPALILLQQEGSRDLGWSGNKRFWWPILALPSDVEPCVFAGSEAA